MSNPALAPMIQQDVQQPIYQTTANEFGQPINPMI
jgi:hypothetical protein